MLLCIQLQLIFFPKYRNNADIAIANYIYNILCVLKCHVFEIFDYKHVSKIYSVIFKLGTILKFPGNHIYIHV